MNVNLKKLSVIFFIASVVGIIVSSLGMYDDVMSTAHTLQIYFPITFGVTPSSTDGGNIRLGVFISVIQIITAAIALSDNFSKRYRFSAFVLLVVSVVFDAWTDIVYRSGYLTGNLAVASVTTIAFYTFGTEILSGFSIALFMMTWRQALADIAWNIAYSFNSLSTIAPEYRYFLQAAKRKAQLESERRKSEKGGNSIGYKANQSYASQYNKPQPQQQSQARRTGQNTSYASAQKPSSQSMLDRLGLKSASSFITPQPPDDDEYTYEDLV